MFTKRDLFKVAAVSALPAVPLSLPLGSIVSLRGTPHLWVMWVDDHLHWAGDTRIISGPIRDYLNWDDVRVVSLTQLERLPIGRPWLSFRLLKDGDPIYLVKWETWWEQPQLFHIQSIRDVELMGINGSNYGTYVLDRPVWETHYSRSVSGWQRSVLASIE